MYILIKTAKMGKSKAMLQPLHLNIRCKSIWAAGYADDTLYQQNAKLCILVSVASSLMSMKQRLGIAFINGYDTP